jgi:hypothetical protein
MTEAAELESGGARVGEWVEEGSSSSRRSSSSSSRRQSKSMAEEAVNGGVTIGRRSPYAGQERGRE